MKYTRLVKLGVISIKPLLIEQFKPLGLQDSDVLLLLKLDALVRSESAPRLVPEQLAQGLTQSAAEVAKALTDLDKQGFLDIASNLTFSLEPLYERLFQLALLPPQAAETANHLIVAYAKRIERDSGKTLTTLELELINKWVTEYQYPQVLIDEVLDHARRSRNYSVRYIDSMLRAQKTAPETLPDVKALFTDDAD